MALVMAGALTACSDALPVRAAVGPALPDAEAEAPRGNGEDGDHARAAEEPPLESVDAGSNDQVCRAGRYVGTYTCQAPLPGGALAFDLVPGRTATTDDGCLELCDDLVVDPEGDKLQGKFLIADFSGQLRGGLDCEGGEFHAEITDGDYGLSGVLPTVGVFTAALQGTISEDDTNAPHIRGSWFADADSAGMACMGSFDVHFEPAP
ncbi:MAG: hypothetical protein QM778_38755 [Myxococcales bacterium]